MSDVYSTSDISGLHDHKHPHHHPHAGHTSGHATHSHAPAHAPAHTQGRTYGHAPSHAHHDDDDDVVKIIHFRRKSTLEAQRLQQHQQQLQQQLQKCQPPEKDEDLIGGSYGPAHSLGAGFTMYDPHHDPDHVSDHTPSTVKDSEVDLLPSKESTGKDVTEMKKSVGKDVTEMKKNAGKDVTEMKKSFTPQLSDSPKVFASYVKDPPASQSSHAPPHRDMELDEVSENTQLLPQATLDAVEDLKLKKENEKPDNLPRSISVVGENVSKDLKLSHEPLDPRTRTNSEGPSMGMEKPKL